MARTLMRFTGVGGQGVLLAGEIFAAAKIKEGGHGLKTATYTSQVRGGPTVVDITLDDEEIFYPYANDGEIDYESVYDHNTISVDEATVETDDNDIITCTYEQGDAVHSIDIS